MNTLALGLGIHSLAKAKPLNKPSNKTKISTAATKPVAICTWQFTEANATAGALLDQGASALDAVINGVAVEEENIKNTTVGKGGSPDREGNVTLDACVMDHTGNCGSVMLSLIHISEPTRPY